ncbi:MAG: hypothetical protein ACYCOU_06505 [Sulfobacillus sp.]
MDIVARDRLSVRPVRAVSTRDFECLLPRAGNLRYDFADLLEFARQLRVSVPPGADFFEVCRLLSLKIDSLPRPRALYLLGPVVRAAALLHITSLDHLRAIAADGRLRPSGQCPESFFTPGKCVSGVYMTLVTGLSFGRPIKDRWFCFENDDDTGVSWCRLALVFSPEVLETRDDWHLSDAWNYGQKGERPGARSSELSIATYEPSELRQYLAEIAKRDRSEATTNEVVFRRSVPLNWLREVWIRGSVVRLSHGGDSLEMPSEVWLRRELDKMNLQVAVRPVEEIPSKYF